MSPSNEEHTFPNQCPFCGLTVVFPLHRGTWQCVCQACGAEGPLAQTREEAIHKWEKRAEEKRGPAIPWVVLYRFCQQVPDSERSSNYVYQEVWSWWHNNAPESFKQLINQLEKSRDEPGSSPSK